MGEGDDVRKEKKKENGRFKMENGRRKEEME